MIDVQIVIKHDNDLDRVKIIKETLNQYFLAENIAFNINAVAGEIITDSTQYVSKDKK